METTEHEIDNCCTYREFHKNDKEC